MDFITGLNRLLRTVQIITGDDDDITTFDDTQHAADIELAQIAIQDELSDLIANKFIDYEKATATISLVTSTRTYALASDFVRFYGTNPSFYDSTDNVRHYEYIGGEDALRDTDYQYKTTEGGPWAWYWDSTTSKSVAFYSVPQSTYNGRSLSYDYEKSVAVTVAADTLPFHNDEAAQAFISCAARRFKMMDESLVVQRIEDDPAYTSAKGRLIAFLGNRNASGSYGRRYT